jgi:hypothetical protein
LAKKSDFKFLENAYKMLHHLVQTKSAEMSVSRQWANKMAAFLPDHKLAANTVNLAPATCKTTRT